MGRADRERKLRIQANEEASAREQIVYQELEHWLHEARLVLGATELGVLLMAYAQTLIGGVEDCSIDNSNS